MLKPVAPYRVILANLLLYPKVSNIPLGKFDLFLPMKCKQCDFQLSVKSNSRFPFTVIGLNFSLRFLNQTYVKP